MTYRDFMVNWFKCSREGGRSKDHSLVLCFSGVHRPHGWHKWPWAWEYSRAGVCLFYSKARLCFPGLPDDRLYCGLPMTGTATVSRRAWPCHVPTSISFCQTSRKQTPSYYWKAKTTICSLSFFLFPVSVQKFAKYRARVWSRDKREAKNLLVIPYCPDNRVRHLSGKQYHKETPVTENLASRGRML